MGPETPWDQLFWQKPEPQGHPAADPSLPAATKKRADAQREERSSLALKI